MKSTDLFSGGVLFFLGVLLFTYGIITFMLPFFVHSISNQAKRTNQLLNEIIRLAQESAEAAKKEAAARSHQAEISIALARSIKETSETLLAHAQYQTDVTKHRIALEEQSSGR
jgi:hypothetical protein